MKAGNVLKSVGEDTWVKSITGIQSPYQRFTEGQTHLIHISTQSTAQDVFGLIETSKTQKYTPTYRKYFTILLFKCIEVVFP